MMVFINDPEGCDGLVEVLVDGIRYDAVYDDYTGDWMVSSEDDNMVQGDYFLEKDGAVQYALERAGVIEDGEYTRAPDRC